MALVAAVAVAIIVLLVVAPLVLTNRLLLIPTNPGPSYPVLQIELSQALMMGGEGTIAIIIQEMFINSGLIYPVLQVLLETLIMIGIITILINAAAEKTFRRKRATTNFQKGVLVVFSLVVVVVVTLTTLLREDPEAPILRLGEE